ncbi:Auxilin-like clathrin uncoating factor SWA2 [Wickerhamomyces ciferrii]|uniref:Auxilin-like clathrin uncoating factor SWA2 n=1 Tax=Wickerhamomyces ciferrii (strain ATCC 14091 / BCRC 22168 / CBS 111 / JCM 3599 / NBRC 0793 / NRRL Y-1031 F-60-10) TaxID=1206466 RepID=K0KJ41_WICCF|nr:Auxilin-like clathrin uncoating factor SWA2 [Wickerhamomyces ciferrii]CCH45250.1 Auxilin-like clathrin uncoating factor SWA2 [Wickerhamomyces ciferrii]
MSKKDDFADLFSAYAPKKKDDSKLSLAERGRNSPATARGNNWADFDYLESSRSSSRMAQAGSIPSTNPQSGFNTSNNNSGSDLFEGFDVINSKNGLNAPKASATPQRFNQSDDLFEGFPSSTPSSNQATTQRNNAEIDLLDSFGDDFSSTNVSSTSIPRIGEQSHSQSPQPIPNTSEQNLDDLFSVFDKPPQPAKPEPKLQNPIPTHSNQQYDVLQDTRSSRNGRDHQQHQNQSRPAQQRSRKSTPTISGEAQDEAIASLVDMGFSIEQANEALQHTKNPTDINGAVSYLMNKAHQEGRARAGLPPERLSRTSSGARSSPHNGGYSMKNANQYFENFTKTVFKASDKLANEVANRFFTPPPSDGKPAWMRDAEKYKRQSEFDEDPEEINGEYLEKLRINEDNDQDEDYRRAPVPPPRRRAHPSGNVPRRSSKQGQEDLLFETEPKPHAATPPPNNQAQSQQEDEIDIFAPLPQKSTPSAPLTASQKLQNSSSNDMMTSSSRRRQVNRSKAPTPSSSTPKPSRPVIGLSSIERETFDEFRERGGAAFKQGDFTTASEHYEKALNSLPKGHLLSIIAYSNCITASFKNGENKKVIEYSDSALSLIGPTRGVSEEIEDGKNMKDFWVKITQRRAEAFEHLEKFQDSLNSWNELIENGSANKVTLDGKRRCLDALNPKPKTTQKPRAPQPTPRKPARSTNSSSISEGEALKRIRETNKASQNFEEDKFKLNDQIEAKVNSWKNGKEDNLRALLASLHEILWSETNWKQVNLADLVMPKKVKITYMKAVAKVHPDKIPQNATSEQKLIAQSVFVVINTAWEKFKVANNIQ